LKQQAIDCYKSDLVQSMLWLNGEPFSLAEREPLNLVYNTEDTDTVLMMGRQYAKSTTIASLMIVNCAVYPYFRALYVAPRREQTSEFSNKKLAPFIQYSKDFKSMYVDSSCNTSVWDKTFTNGSSSTLKYAFLTADAVRGISADQLFLDEVQDIILGNIPIIEECLSGSKRKWRVYAGTPKTFNNTLAQKWAVSTQNEWVLQCPHCNVWNTLTLESIGPKGILCKKCRKDIPITSKGQWVAAKSRNDPGVYFTGFRVPQIIAPTMKWSKIIEKMNTYPLAKFMNEVMALPYDNSANPITETELKAVCGSRPNCVTRTTTTDASVIVLGVDWGHGELSSTAKKGDAATGYTVVTVGRYDYNNKFEVLGMKKYIGAESDPEHQVKDIIRMAYDLKATAIGADYGGGFMHNAILRRELGERLLEWQATDNLRGGMKFVPEAGRMVFNRTECMTERFVELKHGNVSLFQWEDFRHFSPDFLTIFIDYRTDGRSMFYGHVLPDDCFHSYMLCKMTADHVMSS
jgi:hypothetical protein